MAFIGPAFRGLLYLTEMNRNLFAMIFAAVLAACGKSEAPAGPPVLAASEKASFLSRSSLSSPEMAAEAEVKASSGPIELTLLLHRTRLKLGESLWHQLRIKNIGDKEIIVGDQVFHDPWQLRDNIWAGDGLYIEVLAPNGKPLEPPVGQDGRDGGIEQSESGLLKIGGPKEQAMVDGWRKQGLSSFEVKLKLVEFNAQKRREKKPPSERPVFNLKPGEIAETKSWFHYSRYDEKIAKRPPPRPIGEFSELEFFDLDEPGKYKIRAVYDRAQSKKYSAIYKKIGMRSPPELVCVRTPWIEVAVLP